MGKDNGALVPMGLFTRPGMNEVSAVIFSNTATFTRVRALAGAGTYPVVFSACRYNASGLEPHVFQLPRPQYTETVLDGLHLCLNPFAEHPLDPAHFIEHGLAVHAFDPNAGEYLSLAPDGFLIQHGCMSFIPEPLLAGFKRTERMTQEYKRPKLREFPEGEMVPVSGRIACFVDNHLAHYRGWTIVVLAGRERQRLGCRGPTGHIQVVERLSAWRSEYRLSAAPRLARQAGRRPCGDEAAYRSSARFLSRLSRPGWEDTEDKS